MVEQDLTVGATITASSCAEAISPLRREADRGPYTMVWVRFVDLVAGDTCCVVINGMPSLACCWAGSG